VKPLVALFATVFFVLIGSGLDLAVLNPFEAANHEGLVMVMGTTFLAPVLLRLVLANPEAAVEVAPRISSP
jgi:Kef-type K+ transport system membrane component KefB